MASNWYSSAVSTCTWRKTRADPSHWPLFTHATCTVRSFSHCLPVFSGASDSLCTNPESDELRERVRRPRATYAGVHMRGWQLLCGLLPQQVLRRILEQLSIRSAFAGS